MDSDIARLGKATRRSPLELSAAHRDRIRNFVSDSERVLYDVTVGGKSLIRAQQLTSFERAGPRERIFFDPRDLRVGIVTCGGLCPGTNNVIRAAVMELFFHYGVQSVLGFRFGFGGLVPASGYEPTELNPDLVDDIHHHGGSILGSSRGSQDVSAMVDTLERLGVGLLLVIGGDGTMHGAHAIFEEVTRRGRPIGIVAVPKTIDNDIHLVEKTFGFETAFSIATEAIRSAHVEAKGYLNGVGLVKLMGRYSGSIAAYAALAEPDVNLVLVPEVPFILEGEKGLIAWLVDRLSRRRHAVIVVAEGAGQELIDDDGEGAKEDASGNVRLLDVGTFLKRKLSRTLDERGIAHAMKYIDPSYTIRSAPANPNDSIFASNLARHAVHAGMSGRTGLLIGLWHGEFTHVPLAAVLDRRNAVDPEGDLWLAVLESTGQPTQWA